MVSRELRAQKGSRLQLSDGFEQFLVEGRKMALLKNSVVVADQERKPRDFF
jgi:hypothetical protein